MVEDFEGDRSVSLSSLLCPEDESCFDDDEDGREDDKELTFSLNDSFPYMMGAHEDDEYIKMLVSKEESLETDRGHSYGGEEDHHLPNESWLKYARFNAVHWILRMRRFFGFHVQTVYLSVIYLDLFLSRQAVEEGRSWAVWLLSIACLSLSAKMHESKVPLLLDFRVEGYEFESKIIQRMELLVLDTLEWKLCFITPFVYLNYYISKFSNELGGKASLPGTAELILGTMEVVNVMNYRPSVIAAAAVLAATYQRLTKKSIEFKISEILSSRSLNTESVFSCYNLMLKLEEEKLKMLKNQILPDLQSTHTSSLDVLGDGCFTSVGSKRKSKRKRVILNSCGGVCCLFDEK